MQLMFLRSFKDSGLLTLGIADCVSSFQGPGHERALNEALTILVVGIAKRSETDVIVDGIGSPSTAERGFLPSLILFATSCGSTRSRGEL